MAKDMQSMKPMRVNVNYAKAVNSEKDNHYFILADGVPMGEVSGDLIEILDIDLCGIDDKAGSLLSNASLTKMGLDRDEIRGRYKTYKENVGSLSRMNLNKEDREKERKRIEENYLHSCGRRNVNFGFEKMMCIREWLTIAKGFSITKFGGETLERTRKYRLQNL